MGESVNKFRNLYLQKVGIKGIEEKKNLEIILGDEIIDINKLINICAKCTLPMTYRSYIWKIILGIFKKLKNFYIL